MKYLSKEESPSCFKAVSNPPNTSNKAAETFKSSGSFYAYLNIVKCKVFLVRDYFELSEDWTVSFKWIMVTVSWRYVDITEYRGAWCII